MAIKKYLTIFAILVIFFSGQLVASPKWTLEGGAGLFYPEDDAWSTHYGNDKMLEGGISFARRFLSVIDAGFSVSYSQDIGKASLSSTGEQVGKVTYEKAPVDVYLLFRARFSENQWVVPYIGGGYTHLLYRQTIEGQGRTQGSSGGEHVRAGLQILLDPFERDSSRSMFVNYGVINSYFFLEGKQTTIDINNSELGGISYRVGVLLEY